MDAHLSPTMEDAVSSATRSTRVISSPRETGVSFDSTENESEEKRVENILRDGKYGPYIVDGDPHEWGGEGAVATIYMEQHGDDGDCFLPLDYYGENGEDAFEISQKATEILGDCWIEFCNAAVACVYAD